MEYLKKLDTEHYAKVFSHFYDMMSNRGYVACNNTPKKFRNSEWISKYIGMIGDIDSYDNVVEFINEFILYFSHPLTKHKIMGYFYVLDTSCGKDDMKYIHSMMQKGECDSIILVVKTCITPSAKEIIETLGGQVFVEEFFTRNIIKHQFVPIFERLSPDAKSKLLNMYSAKETQFPAMLIGDPISKYYDYKAGDMIKIIRPDEISYRIIV